MSLLEGLASDGVHLISRKGLEHLHAYAAAIGIKRCWFHNGGNGRFPHYDIPKRMRASFFKTHVEVEKVCSREIVAILKRGSE